MSKNVTLSHYGPAVENLLMMPHIETEHAFTGQRCTYELGDISIDIEQTNEIHIHANTHF